MTELRLTGPAVFAAAPHRTTTTVDLDCTPDALFGVFADAASWPIWVEPIQHVEWAGPPRTGVTRHVRMAGGVEVTEHFLVWDPGRHMQFVMTELPGRGVDGFGEDYRVTDLGDGRCRLRWTMALVPAPGPAAAVIGLTAGVTGPALRHFGANLQRYVRDRVPATA